MSEPTIQPSDGAGKDVKLPAAPAIMRVIAHTAEQYGITSNWTDLFRSKRGNPTVADARHMAEVVISAMGISYATIARTFGRDISSIYSAREVMRGKIETDAFYRDRFVSILVRSLDPQTPAPELPVISGPVKRKPQPTQQQ